MARIAFVVHTAGQAHLWSAVASSLRSEGHDVLMVARDDVRVTTLLDHYGERHASYGSVGRGWFTKLLSLPIVTTRTIRAIHGWNPNVVVGTGLIEAYAGILLRKPVVVFDDTELTPEAERLQWRLLATTIVTPACFKLRFGKKHVQFDGYKELAYLHPKYFRPDPTIFADLGLEPSQRYVVARFGAFAAVHDIGRSQSTLVERQTLVTELSRHARVFISSEGVLPASLSEYALPVPFSRIHHVLYHAALLVGDTGTMATEAAVLGTPAVIFGEALHRFGNFEELERRYQLLFCVDHPHTALELGVTILNDTSQSWNERRLKLLNDKEDVRMALCRVILDTTSARHG